MQITERVVYISKTIICLEYSYMKTIPFILKMWSVHKIFFVKPKKSLFILKKNKVRGRFT